MNGTEITYIVVCHMVVQYCGLESIDLFCLEKKMKADYWPLLKAGRCNRGANAEVSCQNSPETLVAVTGDQGSCDKTAQQKQQQLPDEVIQREL